jgi:hypothetical protein
MMCVQVRQLFQLADTLAADLEAVMQRRRTEIMAAQYPDIVKVVQCCGREGFDVEQAVAIASSLSPHYLLA